MVILEVSIDFILNVLSVYIVFRNTIVTGPCHLTIMTSRYNESFFFWPEQTSNHFSRSFNTNSLVRPLGVTTFHWLSVKAYHICHRIQWNGFLSYLNAALFWYELFMGQKQSLTGFFCILISYWVWLSLMWRIMQIDQNVIHCEVEPGREGWQPPRSA